MSIFPHQFFIFALLFVHTQSKIMEKKRIFSPMPSVTPSGETNQLKIVLSPNERCKKSILKFKSIHNLAQASISGNYKPEDNPDTFCRPFLWKSILLKVHIQKIDDDYELNLSNLRNSRLTYTDLIDKLSPPWHLLDKDSIYYKQLGEVQSSLDVTENKETIKSNIMKIQPTKVDNDHHPLSSVKSKKVIDIDTLNMIILDVERLFPDYPKMFIESLEDKKTIIEILYRYSKICGRGYIQGFHEICGVIYIILLNELTEKLTKEEEETYDLIDNNDLTNDKNVKKKPILSKLDSQINEFFLKDYFVHDVFSTFNAFITPLLDKYYTSSGVVQESILFGIKMRHIDPNLEHALRRVEVVGGHAQVWLSRWFRMLATREIGVRKGIRLWDGLISFSGLLNNSPSSVSTPIDVSKLLPFTILLLLMNIRTELLIASGANPSVAASHDKEHKGKSQLYQANDYIDDTDVLFLLLHYPEDAIGSISELIADSASLALVDGDDVELKLRGSNIVQKCNSKRGILGGVVSAPKPKTAVGPKASSTNPWSGMLKRASSLSKSWSTPPASESPSGKNLDIDRMRLELKLQQRVRDKLNN